MVRGEPRHECLGDAAAHVDEAEVARQRMVVKWGERDDLRARVLEQLEVLRVVEAEGVVERDADANRLEHRRVSGAVGDRRMHHPGAAHQSLDEVEVAVAGDRLAELGDGFVHVRVLQQRQQPRAQLRDPYSGDARQGTQHRHARERPDRILDDPAPVVVGDVVEDDADHAG